MTTDNKKNNNTGMPLKNISENARREEEGPRTILRQTLPSVLMLFSLMGTLGRLDVCGRNISGGSGQGRVWGGGGRLVGL